MGRSARRGRLSKKAEEVMDAHYAEETFGGHADMDVGDGEFKDGEVVAKNGTTRTVRWKRRREGDLFRYEFSIGPRVEGPRDPTYAIIPEGVTVHELSPMKERRRRYYYEGSTNHLTRRRVPKSAVYMT